MKSLTAYIMEKLVCEGGHVFGEGTDKIAREDIPNTLDAWCHEMQRIFPKVAKYFNKPQTLGSVGKKGTDDLYRDIESYKDLWMLKI